MAKEKDNKNLHKGHRERLKRKYMFYGLESLAEHEIVELLLFYCIPRRDTNDLAHRILNEYGQLHRIFESSPQEISRRCGVSESTAILLSLIAPLAKAYEKSRWSPATRLDSSRKCGEYAKALFTGDTVEHFYLICLDNQRCIIATELLANGTIDEAHIYPREVIRTVIKHNAASVVLTHNHPSGLLAASSKDLEATAYIRGILQTIDVEVIDHVIVAGTDYLSFAEKRLMGMTMLDDDI